MAKIKISYEFERLCGMRQPGGFYLVGPANSEPCGRLPLPLGVCPCCGLTIKQSRGWTWVTVPALVRASGLTCKLPADDCGKCPLTSTIDHPPYNGRAGLLWVGIQHYIDPSYFLAEAAKYGISKRLSVIPRGFEIGRDWVLLAHPLAVNAPPDGGPGVFAVFRPTAIQYVVRPDDSEDKFAKLIKRGIELVDVRPAQSTIFDRIGAQA